MNRILPIILLSVFFLLLISCENDIKTVTNLTSADTLPLESARDVEVLYSDSAQVQIWMISPVFNRYDGNEPYIDFPRGLKVIFYDKDLKEKSILTCLYARMYERTKIMEARNKVEVISRIKDQKLNTERLIWDQRKARVYSDEFVKVTTQDKVLYGQGFESDQSFDNWVIRRPTGSFSIDKDK
jgi:LPS export ABC transporter protein LptC